MVTASIHFARPITFDDWICYATIVEVLYGVHM